MRVEVRSRGLSAQALVTPTDEAVTTCGHMTPRGQFPSDRSGSARLPGAGAFGLTATRRRGALPEFTPLPPWLPGAISPLAVTYLFLEHSIKT
jgi:hypothetical protein